MKFTKGPWQLKLGKKSAQIYKGEELLASLDRFNYENREANARLMSAAPQMLDALHYVMAMVKDEDVAIISKVSRAIFKAEEGT